MVKLKLPILNNFSFLLLALKATRFPPNPDLSALLESSYIYFLFYSVEVGFSLPCGSNTVLSCLLMA